MTIDWKADYPPTLRVPHIAELYGFTVHTVRKLLEQGKFQKLPIPCERRPYGWNRDDVKRHYERRVAA